VLRYYITVKQSGQRPTNHLILIGVFNSTFIPGGEIRTAALKGRKWMMRPASSRW
jgi:hypothetical protein